MTPLFMCFDTVYIFRVEIGGDRSAFSHGSKLRFQFGQDDQTPEEVV